MQFDPTNTDPTKKTSATDETTSQPAEQQKASSWWDYLSFGAAAATTIKKVVTSKTSEKQDIINSAETTMRDKIGQGTQEAAKNAEMFVQLSRLVSTIGAKEAQNKAGGVMGYLSDAGMLTKAFISQMFANLATKLDENRHKISNYNDQPVLASLFSLLAEHASTHLDQKDLEGLADLYHDAEANMKSSKGDYGAQLAQRDSARKKMQTIFNAVAGNLLSYAFPKGHQDPAIQKFLDSESLYSTVYSQIQSAIAEPLLEEFLSLEKNSAKEEAWNNKLTTTVGQNMVDPFIKAPAMLLGGVVKHLVEFNPAPLDALTKAIHQIANPTDPSKKDEKNQKELLQELSYKNLSNWILESVQAVSTTNDPHLSKALGYGSYLISRLARDIIGKGLTILVPENKALGEGETTALLFDKMAEKVSTAGMEKGFLPEVADFIQDLPVPDILKTKVTAAIKDSSKVEQQILAAAKQVDLLHKESKETLEKYKGGDLIFALIENVSDQIAKKVQGNKSDFIEAAGSDEWVQNILDEFLPGLTIDPALKQSFKANFEVFRKNAVSENSLDFLKKGIQVVLAQALIGTIDESFDKNVSIKDQLLLKFQNAFQKNFQNLSVEVKAQFRKAIEEQDKINEKEGDIKKLQDLTAPNIKAKLEAAKEALTKAESNEKTTHKQIEKLKNQIKELEKALEIALKPVAADQKLQKAFEEMLTANTRVTNAESKVKSLHKQLHKMLIDLSWPADNLETLHNSNQSIENHDLLKNLSPEKLKSVSAALDLYATIQHANKELQLRNVQLQQKQTAFNNMQANDEFAKLNEWFEKHSVIQKRIEKLNQEILDLQEAHLSDLPVFNELAVDITDILGLGEKERIKLPSTLLDKVWPMIEEAKKQAIPLVLFKQLIPIWMVLDKREANKAILLKNPKNEAVVRLVESTTKRVLKEIPLLLSKLDSKSAKPIFDTLEDLLPGVSALESKIIPELKTLAIGENNIFSDNQEFIKNYVEGLLFQFFTNIPSENQDMITGLIDMLNQLIEDSNKNTEVKGVVDPAIINSAIDKMFREQLEIQSEEDLQGVPPLLKKTVFDALKAGAHEVLLPLVAPSLENDALAEGLTALSGSPFLSSFAKALSEDFFNHLNEYVEEKDLKELTEMIRKELEGSPELRDILLKEIEGFLKEGKMSPIAKTVLQNSLLKCFHAIAEQNPPKDGKDSLLVLVDKLELVLMEKFLELRKGRSFAEVVAELDKVILERKGFGIDEAIQTLPKFLQNIVLKKIQGRLQGMLLEMQGHTRQHEKISPTAPLVNQFSHKVTEMAIAALPEILGEVTGSGELKIMRGVSSAVELELEELAFGDYKVASALSGYKKASSFKSLLTEKLKDAANPEVATEEKNQVAAIAANVIAVPLNRVVERSIAFENKQGQAWTQKLVANVFTIAANHLEHISEAEKIANNEKRSGIQHQDFVAAAGVNLHPAVPTKPLDFNLTINEIYKRCRIEENEEMTGKLRAALLELVQHAKMEGISVTTHAINDKIIPILDPANTQKTHYAHLLNPAGEKKLLRAILKEDVKAPLLHRQEKFYKPATNELLDLLFPHGQADLTFVPAEFREKAWKQLKTNLLPEILPLITEAFLSQSSVNGLVLDILEDLQKDMEAGPGTNPKDLNNEKQEVKEEVERVPDALDNAAGLLIEQVLARTDMSSLVKNMYLDKDGKILPEKQKKIGDALHKKLNDSFIKTTLEKVFQNVIDKEIGGAPKPKLKADVIEPKIKEAARKLLRTTISKEIDELWDTAQAKWDNHIESIFGNVGIGMKKVFDAVFRFVFFTVIGNLLAFIFRPIFYGIIQNWIVKTDKNVDALLNPFRRTPTDQGGLDLHPVYNEDLVYKLVDALRGGVKGVMQAQVVVDVPYDKQPL